MSAAPTGHQPRSRRTALIAAIVAVLVVAGVVTGVLTSRGGTAKTPSATVVGYLHDLSTGNAAGALARGPDRPAAFVTAAILARQQAEARISHVEVGRTSTSGNEARVDATYRFGARVADETFRLLKVGDDWKLTETTYRITVSNLARVPQLTLFGKPVQNLSAVDVFPGPLTWGSQSEYYTVTDQEAAKFVLSPYNFAAMFPQPSAELNSTGRQAAQTAVRTAFQQCAASTSLQPPGCPQQERGGTGGPGAPQDGTVVWTAPTDLSGLSLDSGSDPRRPRVTGSATWQARYQARSPTDGSLTSVTDTDVVTEVNGTIDLGSTPPTFTEN